MYIANFVLKMIGNHTFIYDFCRRKSSKPNSFRVITEHVWELVYELTAPYYMTEISLHGDSLHQKYFVLVLPVFSR